jgi:hypothetical protein
MLSSLLPTQIWQAEKEGNRGNLLQLQDRR